MMEEVGQEDAPSNFTHLYKNPHLKSSQNQRRIERLKRMKEVRNILCDKKRGLNEVLDDMEADTSNEDQDEEEPMDCAAVTERRRKNRFNKCLMLSEYLVEKPDDLEQNWLFLLCPKGQRNLVVADRNCTRAYNRKGILIEEFESALPGGSRSNEMTSKCTILDAVYSQTEKCFYVLDVIAWNSHSLVKCTTEFRFFFLKSKLVDEEELSVHSSHNKYPFKSLEYLPAELSLIEEKMSIEDPSLDGVLFYHKQLHYQGCVTPLVGWLKGYMIPEVLNIPVHSSFIESKPKGYRNITAHMEFVKSGKARKKYNKMDVS